MAADRSIDPATGTTAAGPLRPGGRGRTRASRPESDRRSAEQSSEGRPRRLARNAAVFGPGRPSRQGTCIAAAPGPRNYGGGKRTLYAESAHPAVDIATGTAHTRGSTSPG